MERKEKIQALKDVLTGRKSVDELKPAKRYKWYHPNPHVDQYSLANPDEGETKKEFTQAEKEAYIEAKGPRHKHICYKAQKGNEPLIVGEDIFY